MKKSFTYTEENASLETAKNVPVNKDLWDKYEKLAVKKFGKKKLISKAVQAWIGKRYEKAGGVMEKSTAPREHEGYDWIEGDITQASKERLERIYSRLRVVAGSPYPEYSEDEMVAKIKKILKRHKPKYQYRSHSNYPMHVWKGLPLPHPVAFFPKGNGFIDGPYLSFAHKQKDEWVRFGTSLIKFNPDTALKVLIDNIKKYQKENK